MTPHKHAEVIKAWADGAKVQYRRHDGDWVDVENGNTLGWLEHYQYRVKPEREFPHTSMSDTQLRDIFYEPGNIENSLLRVADAAIRQYIIDLESQHHDN